MDVQSGKGSMGRIIVMSLQSTVPLGAPHRASLLLHVQAPVEIVINVLLLSLACLCADQFCSMLLVI